MSLAELTKLCPPPASPVNGYGPQKERELEARYGIRFPKDYLAFRKAYGAGAFVSPDTHTIIVFDPFGQRYDEEVDYGLLVVGTSFAEDKEVAGQAQAQARSLASLFPVGCDTDESYLCWVRSGEPENWKLLLLNY